MPSQLWRTKDSLYLFLGGLFVFGGVIGIFVGVMYWFGFPYHAPEFLPVLGSFCTLVGVVPGLILILMGLRARKGKQSLVEFASWVKTYRRIGMDTLAKKLGKPPIEAEKILIEVVDRGLVKGFIDRETDEFVLQEAVAEELMVDQCPRCRASLQRRYYRGETVLCPYCKSVIVEPSTARKP